MERFLFLQSIWNWISSIHMFDFKLNKILLKWNSDRIFSNSIIFLSFKSMALTWRSEIYRHFQFETSKSFANVCDSFFGDEEDPENGRNIILTVEYDIDLFTMLYLVGNRCLCSVGRIDNLSMDEIELSSHKMKKKGRKNLPSVQQKFKYNLTVSLSNFMCVVCPSCAIKLSNLEGWTETMENLYSYSYVSILLYCLSQNNITYLHK